MSLKALSQPANEEQGGVMDNGLLRAEEELYEATQEHGFLNLRQQQITARVDILNNMNTQAVLIAGAASAALGAEALESLADYETAIGYFSFTVFLVCTALTFCSSMWVIYTSSHIISISQQAALYGRSGAEVQRADEILTEKLGGVRFFYLFSLAMLLLSTLTVAWTVLSLVHSFLISLIFFWFSFHAYSTSHTTTTEFRTHVPSLPCETSAQERTRLLRLLRGAPLFAPRRHGFHRLAEHGKPSQPEMARQATGFYPTVQQEPFQGWLLKTSSREGPLRRRGGSGGGGAEARPELVVVEPRDKRWFILSGSGQELRWWSSQESSRLDAPKTTLSLRQWRVELRLSSTGDPTILLLPKDESRVLKSWSLRGLNEEMTRAWHERLSAATADSTS